MSSAVPPPGGPGVSPNSPLPDTEREAELREAPLGEVVAKTAQDAAELFRLEVALAKAEVSQKAKQLGAGAGLIAAAAVLGLAALGAFTAWAIILIGGLIGSFSWSAIIVTILWLVIAAILGVVGKNRIQRAAPPAPTEATESVKEDVEWVKTQTQSARR